MNDFVSSQHIHHVRIPEEDVAALRAAVRLAIAHLNLLIDPEDADKEPTARERDRAINLRCKLTNMHCSLDALSYDSREWQREGWELCTLRPDNIDF